MTKLTDRDALDGIAAILSAPEWDVETIEYVAALVSRTDRPSWESRHQADPETDEDWDLGDAFYERQYLAKAREHHADKARKFEYLSPDGRHYRVTITDDPAKPWSNILVEQRVSYLLAPAQGPWDGHEFGPTSSIYQWVKLEQLNDFFPSSEALEMALSWLPENIGEPLR